MRGALDSAAHVYQITVRGRLDDRWSDWFHGMVIGVARDACGDAITTLTGAIPDQAALRGILSAIWDLNLVLISAVELPNAGEGEGRDEG